MNDRLPAKRLDAALAKLSPQADRKVREIIIESAAVVQGVRRAAAPSFLRQVRALVGFDMRQARKLRKREMRKALRADRAKAYTEGLRLLRQEAQQGKVDAETRLREQFGLEEPEKDRSGLTELESTQIEIDEDAQQ